MTDEPSETFGNPDFVPQQVGHKKGPRRNHVRLIAAGESDLSQSDSENNDTQFFDVGAACLTPDANTG